MTMNQFAVRFGALTLLFTAVAGLRYFEVGPLALLRFDFWEAVIFGAPKGWSPDYSGWPESMEAIW